METVSTLNVRQGTGKEPQREDCIIKYRCSCCAAADRSAVCLLVGQLYLPCTEISLFPQQTSMGRPAAASTSSTNLNSKNELQTLMVFFAIKQGL